MSARPIDIHEPTVLVVPMLTFTRSIDDYLNDCRARRWAERSIASYGRTLYRFAEELPLDTDVTKVTVDDYRRYRGRRQRQIGRNTLAGEEAHLASHAAWLYRNRKTTRNPVDQLERTKRIAAADLDIATVSSEDVRRLLTAAAPGAERNAVAILAYLGPRRHATARLRLSDYDGQTIRFREKGAKTIWKPAPGELAQILDAAIVRGDVGSGNPYQPDDPYLVPPEGYLTRKGERDDRVVWRLVKRVGERAGINVFPHALRAAFAVFYLERNPDDLIGCQELMGHKSIQTTMTYLRRLNRQERMETVRSLSWAPADGAAWLSESPETLLDASGSWGREDSNLRNAIFQEPCGLDDNAEPTPRVIPLNHAKPDLLRALLDALPDVADSRAVEPEDALAPKGTAT